MEPTAYSVRCAPASGSGSCLAFGFNIFHGSTSEGIDQIAIVLKEFLNIAHLPLWLCPIALEAMRTIFPGSRRIFHRLLFASHRLERGGLNAW
jgi:hypothetical protein